MEKQSIGKYISSIYRHQSIIINERLAKYGIGSGQYIFLINISQFEGINQKDLSDQVKIDRANTNRAIKKLEELDYIYTQVDENDRRNHKSYLTKKGNQLIPLIKKDLLDITEIMAENISVEKREDLFILLQQLNDNVQQYVMTTRKVKPNDN